VRGQHVTTRHGAIAAFLLVAIVCRAQEKFVNEQYDLQKVADGVYSFIAPEQESGVVQANCSVIIGEEAVLLVDSGQFPSLAERMAADIKKLTNKPVRYLVNTHWHFDHNWGNAVFRDAFPGLVIISTEFTREMVASEGPKTLAKQAGINSQQAADLRKMLDAGKLPDGRTIPSELHRSFRLSADTLEHINPDLARTVNLPASIGFEKELTIHLGKREAKVMWLGRANTAGDAVTWVPDVKLLLTGDAVVYPTPFAFGSYMSEWPDVLDKMIALNAELVIPGHGPVLHDSSYLKTLAEMFRVLYSEVKQAVAQGMSLKDAQKKIALDEFREKLAGADAFRKMAFHSAFLEPAIDRAYQEATGKLKPESEDDQ